MAEVAYCAFKEVKMSSDHLDTNLGANQFEMEGEFFLQKKS